MAFTAGLYGTSIENVGKHFMTLFIVLSAEAAKWPFLLFLGFDYKYGENHFVYSFDGSVNVLHR